MITTFSTNQAFGILIEADIDIVTAEEKISFFRENINNSSQTLSYQIDELNYLVIGGKLAIRIVGNYQSENFISESAFTKFLLHTLSAFLDTDKKNFSIAQELFGAQVKYLIKLNELSSLINLGKYTTKEEKKHFFTNIFFNMLSVGGNFLSF